MMSVVPDTLVIVKPSSGDWPLGDVTVNEMPAPTVTAEEFCPPKGRDPFTVHDDEACGTSDICITLSLADMTNAVLPVNDLV